MEIETPFPFWAKVLVQLLTTASAVGIPVVYKAAQLEQKVEFVQQQLVEIKNDLKELRRRP